MDILKFRVRGQALTLTNPNVNLIPVTDTVNQYLCQFEFSEDWDDLNKVVVFKNVSYNITKEVYLSTSNECYIPWEVLSNSGDIFLEVIGTEVRGDVVTVRIPSTLLGFKWQIQEGLLDVSANVSPTPDLFEQFVSSVRSDSIVAATARDEAVIARDVAVQSASDASASELAATSAAESAVNSASTASSAASSASESALSVAGVADETKSYAEIASAKAADASTQAEIAAGAKEDAVIAKEGAEAARDAASTSADLAQTTESHIKTMTVSAHSLAETEAPTVTKTDTSTGFALDFGIPKGATGPKGEDGDNIHYTWVKYADTPTSGMSDNPTGKEYMGIAYNKSTPVGSTAYSDYAWSRIKGETGYSPTVTTGTASDGSTTLTVTNKDGSTTTTLADGKARADIDNLEIGGRNLILESEKRKLSKHIDEITTEIGVKVAEWGANDAFRSYGVCSNHTIFGTLSTGASSLKSILGQAYVFSIYVKNNGETAINITNNGIGSPRTIQPGESTRAILYGTGNGTQFLQMNFICSNLGDAFDVTYWHPKIEIGNKVTDWTPAPEDVDAVIAKSFGLAGGITIPRESDLNDYKTVGNYYSAGSAVSATLSNTPITNDAFMLKVLNGYSANDTNSILLQKIVNSYDGTEYTRYYSGETWKPWRAVETRRLLWTNASPSSSFADQTLSLDLSSYDAVEIQHCYANNATNMLETGIYQKGYTKQYMKNHYEISTSSGAYYIVQRLVDVKASGITFGKGMLKNITGTTNGSEGIYYCIPLKIYGIKGV